MLEGEKELLKALEQFPAKLQRGAMRTAHRKAGAVIAKEARTNVRPISRTIAGAMTTKPLVYKSGVTLTIVGVKRGSRSDTEKRRAKAQAAGVKFHNPAKTAHLVHGGTKPHTIKRPLRMNTGAAAPGQVTIRHPGTKAHPFLTEARDANLRRAEAMFIEALRGGVAKAARDAGGK